MTSGGKRTGTVGYNVQAVVDTKHHLIVEHDVTNVGSDHGQLCRMAVSAKNAMGKPKLKVLADRGQLQRSGYPGVRAVRDQGVRPETTHLGIEEERTLYHARLHLRRKKRRVSMSRR